MKNLSKNNIIAGAFNVIAGLLIAFGPHTIFAVCEAMEGKYMKCHWTAQAETGIGLSIVVLGVLLLLLSNKKVRTGLQIGAVLGFAQALLTANFLIGVCGNEHMQCHSLTLPALNVIGSLGIVFGLVNLVYLFRTNKEKEISYEAA